MPDSTTPCWKPGKPKSAGGFGYSAHGVLLDADVDDIPVAVSPGQPAGGAFGAFDELAEETQDYSQSNW
jgi:hypothetical protein